MNINANDLIWSLEPLFNGDRQEVKRYCLGESLIFWKKKMEASAPEEWDRYEAIEKLFDECARILEEEERA